MGQVVSCLVFTGKHNKEPYYPNYAIFTKIFPVTRENLQRSRSLGMHTTEHCLSQYSATFPPIGMQEMWQGANKRAVFWPRDPSSRYCLLGPSQARPLRSTGCLSCCHGDENCCKYLERTAWRTGQGLTRTSVIKRLMLSAQLQFITKHLI